MKNKNISLGAKRLKLGSVSIILTAVVIAVVVLVNVGVSALPTTLTHFNTESVDMYEIGDVSRKLINSINEKVNVYYYAEKGSEDTIVTEMLSRYEALSPKIKVSQIEPSVEPKFLDDYNTDGLENTAGCVVFESEKRHTVVTTDQIYYNDMTEEELMMYVNYGVEGGTTYFLGESAFTTALDYVTRTELPTIYSLTGHNETELGPVYLDLIKKENIAMSEVNLLTSENVPEDCSVLFINSPTSDIAEAECEKIMAYMDKGGDVILITDPGVYYAAGFPNVTKIANKAGLESIDGYVRDRMMGLQENKYAFLATIPKSELRITSLLENTNVNVIWWNSHGIKEIEGGSKAVITPILTTSGKGVVEMEDGKYYDDNTDGQTVYAAAQADLAVGDSGVESTFVWFASPSAAYDDFSGAWNDEVFMASLGYLCSNTARLSIIGKTWEIEPMIMTDITANVWMIVFTAVIPLAIVSVGFTVWFKRRRK